jgi:polysaccharide biosynthesis transport protein
VDSSPILPIADSRFVSQYVDSVVLSVFRDVSQAPRIRAACEILEAFGVQSVEAVVTGVNDEHLGGKRAGYYQPVENAAV